MLSIYDRVVGNIVRIEEGSRDIEGKQISVGSVAGYSRKIWNILTKTTSEFKALKPHRRAV